MPKVKNVYADWSVTNTNSVSTIGTLLWRHWNEIHTSVTTSNTITSSASVTWQVWNGQVQNMMTQQIRAWVNEHQGVWVSWNTDSLAVNRTENGVVQVTMDAPVSAEERARRERMYEAERARQQAERERYNQEQRRIEAERNGAREKAEKLLQSALNPEQREELKSKGFFHCRSRKGNIYRIYRGSHGNVKRVVNGKEIEKYCIQPSYVPEGDCMLAQKLHIENDEDSFQRIANITRLN